MKTQNPWMGRAKGSAGNMTASKVYDKNVLKAKAFEVNNPNTAAQQNQRTFFKEVTELVNQLTEEQCRFLCPKAPKGMSRRNFLSKQLASWAVETQNQKVVNLASVTTLGNSKEVNYLQTSLRKEDDKIFVDWTGQTPGDEYENSHQFAAMLIDCVNKKIYLKLAEDNAYNEGSIGFEDLPSLDTDNYNSIMFSIKTNIIVTDFSTMGVSERPAR